jgi:hypothetical protein
VGGVDFFPSFKFLAIRGCAAEAKAFYMARGREGIFSISPLLLAKGFC